MKNYEGVFIIRPDLSQDEAQAAVKAIEEAITQDEGSIKESSSWGKRQLTYEIKKCSEGYYQLIQFEVDPGKLGKLEKNYKLNENILRVLLTRR